MSRERWPLHGRATIGDALARLEAAVRPRRVVRGWATVELERAAAELREGEAAGDHVTRPAPDDALLGARAVRLPLGEDEDLVLLEPSTEGPLAASLARYGEGTVALYLVTDSRAPERARAAGFVLSGAGGGPLGRQHRVAVGGPWGPHLMVVPVDEAPPPATIEG